MNINLSEIHVGAIYSGLPGMDAQVSIEFIQAQERTTR